MNHSPTEGAQGSANSKAPITDLIYKCASDCALYARGCVTDHAAVSAAESYIRRLIEDLGEDPVVAPLARQLAEMEKERDVYDKRRIEAIEENQRLTSELAELRKDRERLKSLARHRAARQQEGRG